MSTTPATEGLFTPRDLIGKLDMLHAECAKCDRHGRYSVDQLVARLGLDAKLTDWLSSLSAECLRSGGATGAIEMLQGGARALICAYSY